MSSSIFRAFSTVFENSLTHLPFCYLDCGARGEGKNSLIEQLPGASYVGIEPDVTEADRLNSLFREENRYQFYPVALGKKESVREFYITKNPSCSSFLKPNLEMINRFDTCPDFFEISRTEKIKTIGLDNFCSEYDLRPTFLELDTQGTELEILESGPNQLDESVVALRVEVEFLHFYQDQPLFSDVDAFLRKKGFEIFDLCRYRLKRSGLSGIETNPQIAWAQACYFKPTRTLSDQHVLSQALVGAHFGFEGICFEKIRDLIKRGFFAESKIDLLRENMNSKPKRGWLGELFRKSRKNSNSSSYFLRDS